MMHEKIFLNVHILISHSPSCLNRDEMNMQKSAIFGGVRRVRISSQSMKRAMRESSYYNSLFNKATRTRLLVDQIVGRKKTEEASEAENYDEVGLFLAAILEGKTKPDDIAKYKRAKSGRIETQVIPFNAMEIERLQRLIEESVKQSAKSRIDFLKKEMRILQEETRGLITHDVALSGRMATSDLMYPVDGALAMAHAITTHAVDADIDWFTAVDDLIGEQGETGAGHLNTQEFSSGVFYRYASLNIEQLQTNLGGLPRAQALSIGKHLLHMLATVVPTAKQQSFAAHNPADFALASLSDQPLSLANAFEEPVTAGQKGGLLQPSIERLAEYW